MTISETIKYLKKIKKYHGDLHVTSFEHEGGNSLRGHDFVLTKGSFAVEDKVVKIGHSRSGGWTPTHSFLLEE